MRWSQTLIPTMKETPEGAEIPSHVLMLRAGLIQQLMAGAYTYLPLGYRALRKAEQIIREEMDKAGAVEVHMPALTPIHLWEQTGRVDAFGDVLFANPGGGGSWLDLQLVGTKANRSAIGARIRVTVIEDGKPRDIHRTVGAGSSFGANPLRERIGLGSARRAESVEIIWPGSGRKQTLRHLDAGQRVLVVEDADRPSD